MVLSVKSGLVLNPDYVRWEKGSNVTAINFIPQCVHVIHCYIRPCKVLAILAHFGFIAQGQINVRDALPLMHDPFFERS